ncbi:MAG: PQQ-binding-like beta-propeller repeat protein [Caldisericia bacterium]|nr:PQQ-binding-like beta-propeller repeat protein [Caldisericia bacterium]
MDGRNGEKIFEFQTQGVVRSSAAISGGKIVFGSHDGKAYCLTNKTKNH